MGKYKKGINGRFTGKIGNTVGSTWKGISYMKSLPDFSNTKATEKQISHRAKFRFASKFLQPLYPVIKIGFRTQVIHRSPQNTAMAELMNYAMEGDYPDFKVKLENLVLSLGSLKNTNRPTVVIQDTQAIFSWSESSNNSSNEFATNGVIMVAIAEGVYPEYSICDHTRSEGSAGLYLPDVPSGTQIHCYLAFVAMDDSNRVSNSVHVGTVNMP